MSDRTKHERDGDRRLVSLVCHCGARVEMTGRPGADTQCDKCGTEFNSAGQTLAPRAQWGEETGETANDYDRGFNDPEHAFDGGDY
jgi:hypothetical protein